MKRYTVGIIVILMWIILPDFCHAIIPAPWVKADYSLLTIDEQKALADAYNHRSNENIAHRESLFTFVIDRNNKPLEVVYSITGQYLTHLGFYSVNIEQASCPLEIKKRFEQAILLLLLDTNNNLSNRDFILDDKTMLNLGNNEWDMIHSILLGFERCDYLEENGVVSLTLMKGKHILRWSLKPDLFSLYGADKKELEDYSLAQLKDNSMGKWKPSLMIPDDLKTLVYRDRDLYAWQRPKTDSVFVRDLYFTNLDKDVQPLYEKKYWQESIMNALQEPSIMPGIWTLKVKHILYGGKSQSYEVGIDQLYSVLGDGMHVAVAFEKMDSSEVKFVVQFSDETGIGRHLLWGTIKPQAAFDENDLTIPVSLLTWVSGNGAWKTYEVKSKSRFFLRKKI